MAGKGTAWTFFVSDKDFSQICFEYQFSDFIDDQSAFGSDNGLTHQRLEQHRYVLSTIATDALELKRQNNSIHSVE